jgi:hypothetical protein
MRTEFLFHCEMLCVTQLKGELQRIEAFGVYLSVFKSRPLAYVPGVRELNLLRSEKFTILASVIECAI